MIKGRILTTIKDIARISGISKSTVSRVINNAPHVSDKKRELVKSVMENLDYTPDYGARGMRTNKSSSVGFFLPDYANPFYSEILKGIETVARKKNYMTIVCHTDEDPETEIHYVRELLKRKIDGIVFCTYNHSAAGTAYLKQISKKIPIVFMDPVYSDNTFSSVVSDGYSGTKEAVKYLAGLSCQKIAYIRGPVKLAVTHERFKGYLEGLDDNNISVDDNLIYEGDFSIESGEAAVKYFLAAKKKPDAILAATDLMAIGAIKALKRAEYKIPDDMKVVGFDNIKMSELIEPSLTTIAQPIQELSMNAANILFEQIESENRESQKLVLPCRLVIRESTEGK